MADHKITLYLSPMSPPARCVAYFLKYHKIDSVALVTVDLATDEHKTPAFLKMNPQGTVPVLHDETAKLCLYESTSILQYLCELFNITGTYGLPSDMTLKYQAINALHNAHNFVVKFNMDIMKHWYAPVFSGAEFDLAALKSAVDTVKKTQLKLFEEMLVANGGFIAGKEATCADFRYWTDLFQLSNLGGDATLALLDYSEFPMTQKYVQYGIDNLYTPNVEFWEGVIQYYKWAENDTPLKGRSYRIAETTTE